MSIVTSYDVFCDTCPNWIHGYVGSGGISHARIVASKNGWQYRKGFHAFYDICPNCLKNSKETKQSSVTDASKKR